MAEDGESRFENWKVTALGGFLFVRDAPVCDQAKLCSLRMLSGRFSWTATQKITG